MSIPNVYWGETILTATYLINRLLTRVLNGISPIKHMLSFFFASSLMLSLPSRVFRCVVFVQSHNPHCKKLDPRVAKCVFISYLPNKKGLSAIILRPSTSGESYLEVEVVIESLTFPTQDDVQVQVQEVTKPTLVPKKVQLFEVEVSIPENLIEDVTDDMLIALRKEKRLCVKYPISQFVCTDHLSIQHQSFIIVIDVIKIPISVQEALKDENWVQVMKEEMKALEKNSTWEIVDRPKDKRIYIVKCKFDGTLEQYKTRLVTKWYTQTYRIDYEETFTSVEKMNMVKVILSLVTHFDWNLQQFDVKNVSVRGDIEEEVYMEIFLGFYSHNEKNKVCKLKKTLYGLK
ncbi:hypothetical protein CR513_58903, partial [Mucuna pruriens]